MNKFYAVKVELKVIDNDKTGKAKKVIEQYLVNAISITDAEAKINVEFKDESLDWEVKSIIETKFLKVIK